MKLAGGEVTGRKRQPTVTLPVFRSTMQGTQYHESSEVSGVCYRPPAPSLSTLCGNGL